VTDDASWYVGFLARLSSPARTKVLSLAQTFHYLAGETIFREGDPSILLYLLEGSHIALDISHPLRGRLTLMTIGPGDIFSWSALSETRVETASARAIDEVDALGVKGGAHQDLCCEDPQPGVEIYRALLEVISARLMATRMQAMNAVAAGAETVSASPAR
jgi:CRP/FNR family transcriptional regulator